MSDQASDPFAVLQRSSGNSYVTVPRGPYWFNENARQLSAMSFLEWQALSTRQLVRMNDNDRHALVQMISFISRPSRPDLSIRHLQAFANEGLRLSTGQPHERFRGLPRKKQEETLNPFRNLDHLFRRGLAAGQVLEQVWSECIAPGQFGRVFKDIAGSVLGTEAARPDSDERKKLWSDYIGVIHLAMSMRSALISSGFDVDRKGLVPGALTFGIMKANLSADWIGEVLREAERWSYRAYFQQVIPRPERMISFEPRFRDLSNDEALGKKTP